MKKLFLSMILMALPLVASAYDIAVENADGVTICYNYINNGTELEVTKGWYTGTVNIPEEVTYMGRSWKVTTIGYEAFKDCNLTSVSIPNTVTSIGYSAFVSCGHPTAVHITDLEAWCKIKFESNYSNPLESAHHLYLNGEEIKDLVIPNSITSIEKYVFYGCSGITSLSIPNTVTAIGGNAFSYCSSLTSVTIPNSVLSIGGNAFMHCSSLTSVSIPNSVTSIGNYAFYECSGLTSLTIGNSVTTIGNHVFGNCNNLTEVTIPNSVISIGEGVFYGCTSLTSVNVGEGNNAFISKDGVLFNKKMTSLICFPPKKLEETYYIPNSVTSIESCAFFYCSGLVSISIPNSVTSIGICAFQGCSALTSLTLPKNVKSIEHGTFGLCGNLTSLTIPNSVTKIGPWAFYETGLTAMTIPNSVTTIEYNAFLNCSNLATVTIGTSVNYISNWVFQGCNNLKEVYCYAKYVPETSKSAFQDLNCQHISLFVPSESIDDYKSTYPWSEFGTVKAIEEATKKCATPTISYADKKLTFSCATEGAQCIYAITDSDIKTDLANEVSLSATYEISVYATKSGYENSDIATATLVWTNAIFTETTPETPTSAKAVQESIPVLISAKGGNISVKCEADGQEVNVYTIDGLSLGTATVMNGETLISTSIPSGDIAVVKVGGRSVKVIMR